MMTLGSLGVLLGACVVAGAAHGQGVYYKASSAEFHLVSKSSLYAFRVGPGQMLVHLHWGHLDEDYVASGAAASLPSVAFLSSDCNVQSFDPTITNDDYSTTYESRNALMLEYSDFGTGDFRFPSVDLTYELDGSRVSQMRYKTHEIVAGKPTVDAKQPAFYVNDASEATTLHVTLEDPVMELQAHLWYTVYHDSDIITRRLVLVNPSDATVDLHSIMSATIDFPTARQGYTFTHLSGAWARERHIVTSPLTVGTQSINSRRGASSHQHNPFAIIADGPMHETAGEHFGVVLLYTGGFTMDAEITQTGRLRVSAGIEPISFEWRLYGGETFATPEVALVYSAAGVGPLSRQLHKLMRTRLARGYWRDLARPILVNSWEAMYFDVSEDKIVSRLAEPAADLGLDMVVLDDGWFGERNDDRCCLGDWTVNRNKFPNGLKGVADRVNAMGLKFGIWMEPEMISVNSDLYRANPDWALHVPKRPRSESRNQLVLDLSRKDVRDFVVQAVTTTLASANITFLKWDFNRHLTEVGSALLDSSMQGETYHRFVLGLYDVMERITSAFPRVLFESCSGGGGRFDAALLYYMPQVWTSDNTDAIARLKIQHGTLLAYPASAMASHVSKSPNDQNGRETSFVTRARVAMGGNFGYQLNLLELSNDEYDLVPQHLAQYRSTEDIVRSGDLYRLASPYDKHEGIHLTAWMYVSPDRSRALVLVFNSDYYELVWSFPRIKLQGLDPTAQYQVTGDFDGVYPGSLLMSTGFVIRLSGDAKAFRAVLARV